jgi:hypothetical protein
MVELVETMLKPPEDVADSRADLLDCVFLSPDRIKALGKLYKK